MAQLIIGEHDNPRVKTRKVRAMLADLGVLADQQGGGPSFLRSEHAVASQIDHALAGLAISPFPTARALYGLNIHNKARVLNAMFTTAYAAQTGPQATMISDFQHGLYGFNGTGRMLGDLWHEDLNWGPFDPSYVVAGVGLHLVAGPGESPGNNAQPAATAELFATINSVDGFASVVEYTLAQTGDGKAGLGYSTFDAAYADGWQWIENDAGSNVDGVHLVNDYQGGSSDAEATTMGDHVAIVLFSPTALKVKTDNGAVLELDSPSPNTDRDTLVLWPNPLGNTGTAATTVKKISYYPPTDFEELAA